MLDRPAEQEKGSGFDVRAASARIAHLRTLLEVSDGDAAEAFLDLEGALAGVCDKLRMDALREAISEFDFDGALLKLYEIAKDHAVDWEQAK